MSKKIILGHGSGGKLTRDLIRDIFIQGLENLAPKSLDDGAILPQQEHNLVFTTDSYVVSPLEFPGGDIGNLAIAGTVNDLAVMGAKPLYVSLGIILEEGCEIAFLRKIVASISFTARKAGVWIACGDTKVVEKGKGDGLFINTSGIGILNHPTDEGSIQKGDKVLINGTIGDHGMTILTLRSGFPLRSSLQSDCAPLNSLIQSVSERIKIKWMRDPTRGGVATALNELVENKTWGIMLSEAELPLHNAVGGLSEILGLDPLYSANEGKVIMIVSEKDALDAQKILKEHPMGKRASIIGTVSDDYPEKLVLQTEMGTLRTLGILTSDPLPRIC